MDKHGKFEKVEEMQNHENSDICRMKQANEWIRKNNFRAYTDDYIAVGDSAGFMYEAENDARVCSNAAKHHMDLRLSTENHTVTPELRKGGEKHVNVKCTTCNGDIQEIEEHYHCSSCRTDTSNPKLEYHHRDCIDKLNTDGSKDGKNSLKYIHFD